jgi:hypothetical protein
VKEVLKKFWNINKSIKYNLIKIIQNPEKSGTRKKSRKSGKIRKIWQHWANHSLEYALTF